MRNKNCRRQVAQRSRGRGPLTPETRRVPFFHYVQDSGRWREWSFELISEREAERRMEMGEVDAIWRMRDGEVQVVGYRGRRAVRALRRSPTTLTEGTMEAVSNQGSGLEGWERAEVLKFKVWALIGDARAVAVRPRISDADRAEALYLLRAA